MRSAAVVAPVLVAVLGFSSCRDTSGPTQDAVPPLWASPTVNAGQQWIDGTPATNAGRVYIQEGNQLVGINAANGTRLWSRQIRFAAAPPPTTLIADDGTLYISETDSLMAIDGATGRTIWNVHPDSQAIVVPALDATGFYSGQRGLAMIYALERTSGAIRWKVNVVQGSAYPAFVRGVTAAGDTIYVSVEKWIGSNGADSKGVLVALDRSSGAELWRYETPGSRDFFSSAPVVVGNTVIVNDYYAGPLIAIDARTHAELWRANAGGTNRAVVLGRMIFTAGVDTKVRGIDIETGAVKWEASTGSSAFGLGACGNSVFVSAFHLRRYDAATGALTGEVNRDSYDDFFSNITTDGTRAFAVAGRGTFAFAC